MIVSYEELTEVLYKKLISLGADQEIAGRSAEIIAENNLDGVDSHGSNRFMRLVSMIRDRKIDLNARPERIQRLGSFEIWDGHLGMGVTNAQTCMNRAMEIASVEGIGCVALRNTNHWLRGGSYGIQATRHGYVGICWTTTSPNMPPWGSSERAIGNNPLILAVPYKDSYVMIDSAMAQFSYGAIEKAKLRGEQLSVPGGYDMNGKLTTDPGEISRTWRVLPIGYWKGSGFSILLDMIASGLSLGKTIPEIGKQGKTPEDEYNLCQVFIAIRPFDLNEINERVENIVASVKEASPTDEGRRIFIPSERAKEKHEQALHNGLDIDNGVWQAILSVS